MKIVNIADLVNPETGKTYREENNAMPHKFKIGDVVEFDNMMATVTKLSRDCDGTPLYSLCITGINGDDLKAIDWMRC